MIRGRQRLFEARTLRIIRAMFIEAPVGDLVVRPKASYQMLFGIWWTPLIEWTQASLVFLTKG
jgi:hypothetical protein